jgi:hypothetical protein
LVNVASNLNLTLSVTANLVDSPAATSTYLLDCVNPEALVYGSEVGRRYAVRAAESNTHR